MPLNAEQQLLNLAAFDRLNALKPAGPKAPELKEWFCTCGGFVDWLPPPNKQEMIGLTMLHSQETWVPIDGTTTTTIVFRFHQNSMSSLDLGDDYR